MLLLARKRVMSCFRVKTLRNVANGAPAVFGSRTLRGEARNTASQHNNNNDFFSVLVLCTQVNI
jgi:hypothetical protein